MNVGTISDRIDIEDVCDEAVQIVFTSENSWKGHRCDVAGCAEGFVVCDGNEKLSRRICAAPRETFKLARNMPRIV